MNNVFSRSWTLTKLSFSVIQADKELLVFPFLSAFFSLAVLGAFWLPLKFFIEQPGGFSHSSLSQWGAMFLLYFFLTLFSTFFSVCAVHIIKRRLEGESEGLSESFSFAFSRINIILSWSLLSATVSVLLRMLESLAGNRKDANPIGLVVNLLIGFFVMGLKLSWSIVTLFVIPAMVYKNLGPIEAIKDSTQTIKKTWGESLVRSYGLGLMQFLLLVAGVGTLVLLGLGLGSVAHPEIVTVAIGVLVAAYICVLFTVFSLANTVFNTALYAYAATGEIPKGFSKDVLINAFKTK
jgi:hypothetical protein